MTTKTMKYNPAFLTEEELLASFVVRKTDLELILNVIRENTKSSNQHVLVVGPRGSGKTTLALRAVAEIRRDRELEPKWYPLVFGEESYQVRTAGEFWLEAVFHLAQQTNEERWRKTYEELKSEQNEKTLHDRALAQLLDFADLKKKRILLVVENLNMLLGDQMSDKDAWTLRHTLLNEPRVMLLATATSRFEQIINSGKAMFEVFKVHDLKPMDEKECAVFWLARTGKDIGEKNIRPIKILTGGNPRLLMVISSFASGLSLRQLMEDLMQLVDDHTEYFKSYLDGLPPTERKIYLALADLWDPATAAEVARESRMAVNQTSSLLNRLIGRGAVVVSEVSGRTKWYQVAERMYNIYYLMRRRGATPARVRAVVAFMVDFYEPEQLLKATSQIAEEACTLKAMDREPHNLAFYEIVKRTKDPALREALLNSARKEFFEGDGVPEQIRSLKYQPKRNDKEVDHKADSTGILKLMKDFENLTERPEDVEKAYALLKKGTELSPKDADVWYYFGKLLHRKMERYEEAETAYRKAIEINPHSEEAWYYLGQLLHYKIGRYEEAEEAYIKSIQLNQNNIWSWYWLAELRSEKTSRFEEAEEAYQKAIEIDPDFVWAWDGLGVFFEKAGRNGEAEAAYRKAIGIDPSFVWAWYDLGDLLHSKMGRHDEAEDVYRKSIELNPNSAWPWYSLGVLLHEKTVRFKEAEAAYRKAIEIEPDSALYWFKLGELLHEKMELYEEADAAYRKALSLDPTCPVLFPLLSLSKKIPLKQDLIELAQKHIRSIPKNEELLNAFAWIFFQSGNKMFIAEALKWASEAVVSKPEDANFRHTLASILISLGRIDEALEHAEKSLTDKEVVGRKIREWAELLTRLAARDRTAEVMKIVLASPCSDILEPLIVGIKLYSGMKVRVAAEILEVGKDVAKQIEEYSRETKSI